MQHPPETSEFQAFVAIAEAGSVSAAAAELGLPRATISRRLARLEERLEVRLIQRTTRRLRLTDAGEELFGHARGIVLAVETATRVVRRDHEVPRGPLRISVPPIASPQFHRLLLAFADAYPEVELEVISSTLHEDLVAKNIDVAWRAAMNLDPGLVARRLATTRLGAVASPTYLKARGRPESVEDLKDHDLLVSFLRGERPMTHWPLQDGTQHRLRYRHRMASNDLPLLMEAALQGRGVALLPLLLCGPFLDSGELVRVLEGGVGMATTMALVFVEREHMKPAVRAFVDFVSERFASHMQLEQLVRDEAASLRL